MSNIGLHSFISSHPHPEVANGDDHEGHDVLEGDEEDAVDPEEPGLQRNLQLNVSESNKSRDKSSTIHFPVPFCF